MIKKTLLLSLFVALAPASTVFAGETEHKIAVELVRLVTPRETYQAMLEEIHAQMRAGIEQGGGKVTPEMMNKVKAAVAEALPYDELIGWSAEIYADKFAADELKGLLDFYKTPLGKKTARLMPEISGEAAKKVGALLPERLPALLKKHGVTP